MELGGFYRVGQWTPDERKVTLDVLGGARYWDLKGDLSFSAPSAGVALDNSRSREWVDPFVGLRMNANLTSDLYFQARADAGGFGVRIELHLECLRCLRVLLYPVSQCLEWDTAP